MNRDTLIFVIRNALSKKEVCSTPWSKCWWAMPH